MKLSNTITIIGISLIFSYCITQILNFYGVSITTYGIYLVFFAFMSLTFVILPHGYPSL
jgi:hypothetical protein